MARGKWPASYQPQQTGKSPAYRFYGRHQAGWICPYPDYNGHRQEGLGPADMTVHKGRRWSTANAYLRPALKRGNLRLFTRMLADKILFDGRRAIGVKTYHWGQVKILYARKAVILSAGAIASPAILHRSGIGPAGLLKNTV